MDLLAQEVGLNKGTLYHYYPSKSAILFEMLSGQVDATLGLLERVPQTGTATEQMREFVRLQIEHVSTKSDELVVFFQEIPWIEKLLAPEQVADLRQRIDRYERFAKQLLSAGVRAGEFRELNPGMVMYSIIGIFAYVPGWFRSSAANARTALIDEVTEFVLSGLVASA